jgi:hypothetical protein
VVIGEGNAQADRADRAGMRFWLSLVPGYRTWSSDRAVRIRVTYGAPASEQVRTQVVTVTRRRVKATRITGLTARRDGEKIRVRWRTTRTPVETSLFVSGSTTRDGEPIATTVVDAFERHSFRAAIAAAGVRWVTVRMRSSAGYTRATVRVKG